MTETPTLGSASPDRTDLPAQDDYLTVTMLAAGLASIVGWRSRRAAPAHAADGLLPAPWRVGFSRLWWTCSSQAATPPCSDLELLEWCTTPFTGWPVVLDLSEEDLQHALLAGDAELSVFAEQAARIGRYDVEAEWIENRVFDALKTAARRNADDEDAAERNYADLRRFLIDSPVITDRDLRALERRYPRTDANQQTYVQQLIDVAYVSRPASGAVSLWRCRSCRNPIPDSQASCGTDGCARAAAEQFTVKALAAVFEQHRATRLYIRDPGLVEARIIDVIAGNAELAGRVRVTAYPRMDLLDILIEFLATGPDGVVEVVQTWGVDAKDQASARLLAKGFVWPQGIDCDKRLIALPMHRARQADYVATLRAELEGRVRVDVVDEEQLVRMVADLAGRLAA